MGVLPRARINDKLREETRTDRVMRSLAAWAASKLGRGDQRTVESFCSSDGLGEWLGACRGRIAGWRWMELASWRDVRYAHVRIAIGSVPQSNENVHHK